MAGKQRGMCLQCASMAELDTFKNQKKLRKAEFITPPNVLKHKIGSGGLEPATLVKAQELLANNTTDFKPLARELLADLETSIQDTRNGVTHGEAAVEAMLYPAVQLKTQGAMFHFPLVSEISDILVNFLETITTPPSEDVLEIVTAHKMAISVIVSSNMTGNGTIQAQELKNSLLAACSRYYKTKKS